MSWFMGIDIGSESGKGVIIGDGNVLVHHILPSGFNYGETANRLKSELLKELEIGFEDISFTVATGQGEGSVSFANESADDIRCTARGINRVFPQARTIIDVCAQSSRVIRISQKGQVTDFVVSEKCAAGSGQFLRIIGNVLRVNLDEIGELSLKSKDPVQFTTGCAVFWETEAVSRVSEGFSKEDILAGVHRSMAEKIASLLNKVGLKMDCTISGGGGLDIGLVKAIEDELGIKIEVPPDPQIIAALGAAVMAIEMATEIYNDKEENKWEESRQQKK